MLSCRLSADGIHFAQRMQATPTLDSVQPSCAGAGFFSRRFCLTSYASIGGSRGFELQRRAGNFSKAAALERKAIRATAVEAEVEQWTADKLIDASEEFKAKALIKSREQYDEMYKRSVEDPDGFWSDIASEFHWEQKWDSSKPASSWNLDVRKGPIYVEWFKGGKTNIAYNAVDRHVKAGRGGETAILWEGNDVGRDRKLTFQQLQDEVCQVANYLRSIGVKKGDSVTIYMPMLAELPVTMLACMRIGAVHSVVFAGFSADSLAGRMMDSKPRVVLTCSAVRRGNKVIGLKEIVDKAADICSKQGFDVERVLVYDNENAISREKTPWKDGRDEWWQDRIPSFETESPVEWVDAEDPSFMLYTSGSTGKPKGVLHTTGGYMLGAATSFKYIFDYRPGDVYWCTADCGWITGHTYLTYGPLLNGASIVVFEGVPTYPDAGRCWEIVDKYQVTLFYTAPTAIRALQKSGNSFVTKYSRKSLRVLGSVGEPINPNAWRWYYEVVGDSRCPIVDTWWQTETGSILITPLPGAWPQKPGSATLPFFGVQPAVVDENGREQDGPCSGYLCMKAPPISLMRTLYGDQERYETAYFAPFKGFYFSGDGCRRDEDGYYWLTGRVDDVINVSGHRIGTAEVESALVSHSMCAEAAVVGYDHEIKGQGIYAFVTLMEGVDYSDDLRRQLVTTVRSEIGAFAAPDVIHWAPGLPKTRSGKIMRRILRKIAANQLDELGDTSTLAEPAVVDQLIELRGK
ncbi:AMP-dependent synthetase and ligase family protein [Klebsormidium nitens]|uniref:Acetyl-coenzyme A synthetase n=1 Tax=Klebsormidium nitens TaxID=105231 RepID=A0A1Y1HPT9_KLENI|nr:AMP-dependent synthetase and ligase family protein [Klebsormidium nitens]|eukprot:GAQ78587.1 AMP-dependent synthetase and ligase family protein [Klebsormidium nitens]